MTTLLCVVGYCVISFIMYGFATAYYREKLGFPVWETSAEEPPGWITLGVTFAWPIVLPLLAIRPILNMVWQGQRWLMREFINPKENV